MKKAVILLFVFLAGIMAQGFFASREIARNAEGFERYRKVFRLRMDPRYYTRHLPDVSFPLFNTNEEGFRDTESFEKKITENCERPVVVLMGGSGVFGTKLNYPQTLGNVLQEEMQTAGMPVRVFNLGQLGFTAIQGKRLAEDWFPVLRPDLLILNYGHYDMMPATSGLTMNEMLEGKSPGHLTFFGRKLQLAFLNLLSVNGYHPPMATLSEYHDSLLTIAGKGKEYSAEAILLPTLLSEKYLNEKFNFNESMLRELKAINSSTFSSQSGILFADLLRDMTAAEYFLEDGAHYSAIGVRALAKKLVPDVIKSLKKKTLNQSCGQKSV